MKIRLFSKKFIIDGKYIGTVKNNKLRVYDLKDINCKDCLYIFSKKEVLHPKIIRKLTVIETLQGFEIGCCLIKYSQLIFIQNQFKYINIFG